MDDHHAPRSPDEVRGFFTRWLDASNTGDWDTVGGLMHPDITLIDPMSPAPFHGHSAALAQAKAQYEPFPDGRVEMLGAPFVSLDEPELAYRWRFTGTHARTIDPPGFAPTGRIVEAEGTSVLRFRDHQVIDVRLQYDTTAVARQILAAPPAGSPLERIVVLAQRARARRARRS